MKRGHVIAAAAAAVLSSFGVTSTAGALGVAQPQVVSADPADTTPHVKDGSVLAIAAMGARVYVGGSFTTVVNAGTSAHLTRPYLFAFDAVTGTLVTDFRPQLDRAVETIAPAPDGRSIVIGGRFTTVNGVRQRSLAMLAPDGSRVPTFAARTNGYVNKALVRNGTLYAAGRFTQVNGQTLRSNLAAFNATTGAVGALNLPVTEGRVKSNGTVTQPAVVEMDATADGSRLVIVGNFRRVGGLVRQQIAMIAPGARTPLTSWQTNRFPNAPTTYQCAQVFDTQMRDVEFSQDGGYFVVVTTGGAPDRNVSSLCDTATRWRTAPVGATGGEREVWRNCTGGDTLYSVAVAGRPDGTGAVYVGGHQRWLDNCGGRDSAVAGSFAADGIGAIDAATGRAIRTWNPGRTRGVGAEELTLDPYGLYVGSDTEQLGGEYHARLGFLPLP